MPIDRLLAWLRGRRSIRSFTRQPLPEGTVETLLEAARWAPSASNRQPYRFAVVSEPPALERLAEAVRDTMRPRIALMAGDERRAAERFLESCTFFPSAPLLLAPFHRERSVLGERIGLAGERDLGAIASVSAAIMNLLLAAHVLGLGACWMTGPLVAAAELERLLGIPQGWRLSALIPVGYPAETPAPPPRHPIERLRWRAREMAEGTTKGTTT